MNEQEQEQEFDTLSVTDTPASDAFGRQRVSAPHTLFDSKQLFDNLPFFWDDQETAGSGTGSTHDPNTASSTLTVSTAAGKRTRQTFRRFNYQPGKSQLILATLSQFDSSPGVTKRVGYFDDDNGLFFQSKDGVVQVVQRSKASGVVVDTVVDQSDWNVDTLDRNGPYVTKLDPSKSQIIIIDFEWLGVGRVRMGYVIDGVIYYVHQFLNANNLSVVYMSTPNLPVRYEIENDGTGPASSLEVICSSVMSEGGVEQTGIIRSRSTAGTPINANTTDVLYAALGLRLKPAYLGTSVELLRLSMLVETNDSFEWSIWWNPTVAGTFTYADEAGACQTAQGDTPNTLTGGTLIDSGYTHSSSSFTLPLENALRLGSTIGGTPDALVIGVRPLGANADVQATLTWRELL